MLRDRSPLWAWLLAMAIAAAPPGAADPVPSGSPPATVMDRLAVRLADRDRLLTGHGVTFEPRVATDGIQPAILPQVDPAPDLAPKATMSDVRLGLMQVALAAGSAGQTEIMAALPAENTPAIYLREGTGTLADLALQSAEAGHPDALQRDGDSYTANVPMLVMLGASLTISEGETLELATQGGAFLVSFGTLSIEGATLRATGTPDTSADGFRPFVASLGTGNLRVRDSRFSGLGFGAGPAMMGVSIVTGGLYRPEMSSAILNSEFADTGGISVTGGDRVRIEGNLITNARQTALWVDASDNVRLVRNMVTETRGEHALRFGGPSRGGVLRDNVFATGAHAALRLDDHAVEVELSGNLIEDFQGSAVVFDQGARCVWMHRNVIRDNGGTAINVAISGAVVVTDNVILDNGGTGLVLSGGTEREQVLAAANVIAGNLAGIRTATQARLRLANNDLWDQLPRLVSGDLAQHTPLFLRAMQAGRSADLDIRRVAASPAHAPLPQDAGARAFAACQDEVDG